MPSLSPDDERLLNWLRYGDEDAPTWAELPPTLRRRRQYRPQPREKLPEAGSLAAVLLEAEPQGGPELARRRAKQWANEMFTPVEARAWLDAGFRGDELGTIVALRAEGVTPALVATVVRGETLLDRIRNRGYSARDVVITLRNAGLLDRRTA